MSVRTFRFPWSTNGARSMFCALLLGGVSLAASEIRADTGNGDDSSDSGDGNDADDGDDTGDTGDTADPTYSSDSGDYSDVYEGLGPAELAKELGGGCGFVGQSASFVGLMLCLGSAGRRRSDPQS